MFKGGKARPTLFAGTWASWQILVIGNLTTEPSFVLYSRLDCDLGSLPLVSRLTFGR